MSEVDQRKDDMMSAEEISVFSLEADEEAFELVAPCETAFDYKAPLVSHFIKNPFASALGSFSSALIFFDVGHQPMIKAGFARGFGVKGWVGVEQRATDFQAQTLE